MWDNARPHAAHDTQSLVYQRDVELVKQPAYSPDLNMCDRYLFRKVKHQLQGHDFDCPDDVKMSMQQALWSIPEDELFEQLKKLRKHCEDIIQASGDYVT